MSSFPPYTKPSDLSTTGLGGLSNPSSLGGAGSGSGSTSGSTFGSTSGTDTMERARQGAHDTIDRLSDAAAPAIENLEDTVAQANERLQSGARQVKDSAEQWTETLRQTVRDKPIVAVAAALAIGMLVARISR